MYIKTTLLALCAVFTLSNCTTLKPPPLEDLSRWIEPLYLNYPPKCKRISNNEMVTVPKWVCTLPEVKTDTGAYGVGIAKAGGGRSLQLNIAQSKGRIQIAEAIQTQIESNLQKEEVRGRILELSDNTPKISREEIVVAIDVVVRNIRQDAETVYGAEMLENFTAPDGTIYMLMGITNPERIRKSVEEMIQGAMDVDKKDLLGLRCQQVEKCLSISKLLSTAIDSNPTIDSDSR